MSQNWVIDFTGNCLLEMREAQECSMTVLFGAAIVAHTFTPYRFSVREHTHKDVPVCMMIHELHLVAC